MGHIELVNHIAAPADRCFDLSRDIGVHQESMRFSQEVAVAGVIAGLIGPAESVTWEARHFGIRWRMTSRITDFDRPRVFVDESNEGPFAAFGMSIASSLTMTSRRCATSSTSGSLSDFLAGRLTCWWPLCTSAGYCGFATW